MQIGMIRLGRMKANMVQRLMSNGHECVVYDLNADAINAPVEQGAHGSVVDSWLPMKQRWQTRFITVDFQATDQEM